MSDISELLGTGGQPLVDENQLDDGLERGTDVDIDIGTDTPVEDPAPAPASKGTRVQKVPISALHEERTRRQELQEQLNQRDQMNQTLNERLTRLLEAQAAREQQPAPKQDEAPPPAFVDDPEGYINWMAQRFEQRMQQLEQHGQQQVQLTQQQAQHQNLLRSVSMQEEQFRKAQPDYSAAVDWAIANKRAEYAALGLDPVSTEQQVQRDFLGIAQFAAQNGKNAAELIYNAAKARGYAPQPANTKTVPKQAPTSLSGLSGHPDVDDEGTDNMTAEKLASMSDAEFDKWFEKQARSGIQRPAF